MVAVANGLAVEASRESTRPGLTGGVRFGIGARKQRANRATTERRCDDWVAWVLPGEQLRGRKEQIAAEKLAELLDKALMVLVKNFSILLRPLKMPSCRCGYIAKTAGLSRIAFSA